MTGASMTVRPSLSRSWKALSCSWAHKPRTIWIPMKIQRRGWSTSLKNGEALHLDQGGVHLVELSISKVSKNPNPDLNISPPCFTSTSKTLYSQKLRLLSDRLLLTKHFQSWVTFWLLCLLSKCWVSLISQWAECVFTFVCTAPLETFSRIMISCWGMISLL